MVVAPEVLPGITGHEVYEVLLGEGVAVVCVELQGGVAAGVVVEGLGTTAGLVCVVVGSFTAFLGHALAVGLGKVGTQVQVQAKVFETVDLVVNLGVSEETGRVGGVGVKGGIEESHGIERSHGVGVALLVQPGGVTVETVLIKHGLGGVVVVGGADGALVGIAVISDGALTV